MKLIFYIVLILIGSNTILAQSTLLEKIKESESQLKIVVDQNNKFKLFVDIALWYSKINIQEAEKYCKQADNYRKYIKDNELLINYYYLKVKLAEENLEANVADQHLNTILSLAYLSEDNRLMAKAYLYRAELELEWGNAKELYKHLVYSKRYIEQITDSVIIAKYHYYEGAYLRVYKNDIKNGLEKITQAIEIGKRNHFIHEILFAYEQYFSTYFMLGDIRATQLVYDEGIAYCKQYGDKSMELILKHLKFKITKDELTIEDRLNNYAENIKEIEVIGNLRLKTYASISTLIYFMANAEYVAALDIAESLLKLFNDEQQKYNQNQFESFYVSYMILLSILDSDKFIDLYKIVRSKPQTKNLETFSDYLLSKWYGNRGEKDSSYVYSDKAYQSRYWLSLHYQSFFIVNQAISLNNKGQSEKALRLIEQVLEDVDSEIKYGEFAPTMALIERANIYADKNPIKYKAQIIKDLSKAENQMLYSKNSLWKSRCFDKISIIYQNIKKYKKSLAMIDSSTYYYSNATILALCDKGKALTNIYNLLDTKRSQNINQKSKIKNLLYEESKNKDNLIVYDLFWTLILLIGLKLLYDKRLKRLDYEYSLLCIKDSESSYSQEVSRIRKDLHDEVGSSLSSLSMKSYTTARSISSQVLKTEIVKYGKEANNTSRVLSDYVWSLSTENLHFNRIASRIIHQSSSMVEIKDGSFFVDEYTIANDVILESDTCYNYIKMMRCLISTCCDIDGIIGVWINYSQYSNCIMATCKIKYETSSTIDLKMEIEAGFFQILENNSISTLVSMKDNNRVEIVFNLPYITKQALSFSHQIA